MNYFARLLVCIVISLAACKPAQKAGTSKMKNDSTANISQVSSEVLKNILNQYPQYFEKVLNNPQNRVQIIYTQIDRSKRKSPEFTNHFFNISDQYFYPASTVKLPVAVLALQKLHELNLPGLDMNTTMITESDDDEHSIVYNDPNSPDGRPTIANYIKKILLVSDNDAFNRLYEFLGQEYINNNLHKMGYEEVQIVHRLDISMTESQNRYTNPVKFFDTNGKLIYTKPAEISKLTYAPRNTKMGKGFYRRGQLVNDPFDFSQKNRLWLTSLHQILRSIIFPESVHASHRFGLNREDYLFLQKYMSMVPRESKYPAYDIAGYQDSYVKFLFYGAEKTALNPDIRIFNKVGDAYGFLIDAAYVMDYKKNIEFLLSAMIYCNSDEIFNDDKYDYDSVGLPFMKHLGQVIYEYELKRKKKYTPDLKQFLFDYSN